MLASSVAVFASLPVAEEVTMEATVMLECSSAHEMMVMENVPVNLAEIVMPFGSFAEMTALERLAEMPVLLFDHPTLAGCSAYPIGCRHESSASVLSLSPPGISSSSVPQPSHCGGTTQNTGPGCTDLRC